METKEEIIRKVIFDLPHYSVRESMSDDEWYGWFEEVYDKATTSQQQTIERLREGLRIILDSLKLHTKNGGHPESICRQKIDAAEQLLNTTEPELDEQQLDHKRIEELTERNVHIVGSFMEHCESEGFVIPDHLYESYFNA